MFVIHAELTAKPGCADAYEKLLRKTISEWSKEPCFVKFAVHRSKTDPHRFMLWEVFTSEEEYNVLYSGEFFKNQSKLRAELVVETETLRSDWTLIEEFGPTRTHVV